MTAVLITGVVYDIYKISSCLASTDNYQLEQTHNDLEMFKIAFNFSGIDYVEYEVQTILDLKL